MKYKFEQIAINSTVKKLPEDSDRQHYIGLEHLDTNSLFVSRWGSDVTPVGEKLLMKKGDVLFGKRRAYQRKVGIAPFDGIFSAHGMVLRPKEDVIDKDYFPFFISSDQFMERAVRISVGGLSPTINWKDLKEQLFEIPSLEEQKTLAAKLWAAYKLREEYKHLLAVTDEMVKSRFIEMFGNPVDIQGNGTSYVGDYCNVISGFPFKSELFNEDKAGKPLIRIRDVARGYTETYTTEECEPQYVVRAGDLLVGMDGNFTISAWQSDDALLNQRVCMIIPKNDSITRNFIIYAIQPVLTSIEEKTNATTVKHISASQISSIAISAIEKSSVLEFDSIIQQADKSKYLN